MFIFCISIAVMFSLISLAISDEIEIRKETPFTYVCLECSGPSSQILPQITQFIGAVYKQRLVPTGKLLFLFYDNPGVISSADDVRWEVALPVSEDALVSEPLTKKEYNYTETAYFLFKGPYEQLTGTYSWLMDQIEAKGYKASGPTMQRHLDDPNQTKPEDLRTEMIIPIEKK